MYIHPRLQQIHPGEHRRQSELYRLQQMHTMLIAGHIQDYLSLAEIQFGDLHVRKSIEAAFNDDDHVIPMTVPNLFDLRLEQIGRRETLPLILRKLRQLNLLALERTS